MLFTMTKRASGRARIISHCTIRIARFRPPHVFPHGDLGSQYVLQNVGIG
jgi:hypothetical protein